MASAPLTFPLTCERRARALCSITPVGNGGWILSVEVDDHVVFARHCSEWHRVERLRDWLERQRFWTAASLVRRLGVDVDRRAQRRVSLVGKASS
jgi:hypothetical protein